MGRENARRFSPWGWGSPRRRWGPWRQWAGSRLSGDNRTLRFRGDSGRQDHTVGAYKEERQAELRTEAKAKEAQASRPPESEPKCGRRTDGRRPQLRFCVNKVALFPVLKKKSLRSNLWSCLPGLHYAMCFITAAGGLRFGHFLRSCWSNGSSTFKI